MVLSTRGIWAIGLGIVGLSLLVGPIVAQQDGAVRKTTGPTGGSTAAAPAAPVPPMIGTVDMDAVFKGYEKFKATNKEFQAAVLGRQNELMKLKSEYEDEGQMLSKLTPGTADFKKHEDKVTELKARFGDCLLIFLPQTLAWERGEVISHLVTMDVPDEGVTPG